MKATRNEMYKSMLSLKYLKEVRDKEQKNLRHEQPKNTQGTRHV